MTTFTRKAVGETMRAAHINELQVAIEEATASGSIVANQLANVRSGIYNVRDYGAVGDGITDDTDALVDAFTAADVVGGLVYVPGGTYLTDTIEYRGQSIIGAGMGLGVLCGKPGQDVLHVDPSVSQFYRQQMILRDFTIEVDDSVDASASFPERGGVGNAGLAVDYADGTDDPPLMFINSQWDNVEFVGSSETSGGQNNVCGIYTQFGSFDVCSIGHLYIRRLAYGWWDDYPTSNLASVELYRDHVSVDFIFFQHCEHAWRILNAEMWNVDTLTIHTGGSSTGLTLAGRQSLNRNSSLMLSFHNMFIEGIPEPLIFDGDVTDCSFESVNLTGGTSTIDWSASRCFLSGANLSSVASPAMSVSGHANVIDVFMPIAATSAEYMRDLITDLGAGNKITVSGIGTQPDASRVKARINSAVGEKHVPDAASLLMGHTDPMFVSGNDLLIHPLSLQPGFGSTEGVDHEYIADATADYGVALRVNTGGDFAINDDLINGINGFRVGKFLPPTRVRVYFKAKAATGGSQTWTLEDSGSGSLGSGAFTLTTSYAVYAFNADLSSQSVGDSLILEANTISGGGAAPVDVAWVAFRPYAYDVRIADEAWDGGHLVMGAYHLWIDSTGDLRIKSSAPGSDLDGSVVGSQS